ncbi:hypothetical protein M0R45_006902 [Rubus argutus]|uniref:Uncharacterized protein n=1 Tax=Rubus argutus TaxID=59490 RepID=A0AAW1YSH3_RUBAR
MPLQFNPATQSTMMLDSISSRRLRSLTRSPLLQPWQPERPVQIDVASSCASILTAARVFFNQRQQLHRGKLSASPISGQPSLL